MRKNFVIFGMGRTGSTLLASLLNSHPMIRCEGEIFHRQHGFQLRRPMVPLWRRYPLPYLGGRRLYTRLVLQKPIYGFKLHTKLWHEQILHPAQFLVSAAHRGWKIIFLERSEVFNQVLSGLIAAQTFRYFGNEPEVEPLAQLSISVEKFATQLQQTVTISHRNREMLAELPHLSICYETHLADASNWVSTVAQICDYLEIPAIDSVASQITKPWSRPYAELVTNYVELRAFYQTLALAGVDRESS